MAAKRVELETRSFPNQKTATEFFQSILYRYEPGMLIPDPDHSDLAALILRHPNSSQKIGTGIESFSVMKAIQGTVCFCVYRVDGSSTDFSMGSCITGRGPSKFQEVSTAFRNIVSSDMHARRDSLFSNHANEDGFLPCAQSGILINRETGHMDHRPPMTFQVIVRTFLAAYKLELDDIKISESRDNQFTTTIEDDALSNQFRSYHLSVANVDFVSKDVNLAQSARHRIRPTRT